MMLFVGGPVDGKRRSVETHACIVATPEPRPHPTAATWAEESEPTTFGGLVYHRYERVGDIYLYMGRDR